MPDFRRVFVPGGSYFFTVNLLERRGNRLLVDNMDALREAVRKTKQERPFRIDAWVVLPEHMHMMLTLPPGDSRNRTAFGDARQQRRTRHLATAILGTPNPRRAGFREALRLRSLQPGQARSFSDRRRLAVFDISSLRRRRVVSARLGRRRCDESGDRRMTARRVERLRFRLVPPPLAI